MCGVSATTDITTLWTYIKQYTVFRLSKQFYLSGSGFVLSIKAFYKTAHKVIMPSICFHYGMK